MNKIEISNPRMNLINFIRTPPKFPSKNMLAISESGADIHLAKNSTKNFSPVIMKNDMTA